MSHFVGIGLVLAFLIPHTSTALYLVNPILCLFYQCFKLNKGFYKYNWIVLVPLFLTLLINLPQGVSYKAVRSCVIILLYFACFPMVGRVRIPNIYLYIILLLILFSQLIYLFNLQYLIKLINIYYPFSERDFGEQYMQDNINANNFLSFRLGGIYRNSNQCARYLTFLMAGFIILNREKSFKSLLPFILVSFFAVILTGSRTGFVVASLLMITYLFVDKRISSLWKTVVGLAAFVAFIWLAISGSNTFRGFNVIEGFSNSANVKMDTFAYYLSSEKSIFKLLMGYLDAARFDKSGAIYFVLTNFDSDYGDIVFCYGFIGFIAILLYFITIFKKLKREMRVFFVLLLWMYSSTVVTSYRAFFIFMLMLSVLYSSKDTYIQD